MLKLCAPKFSRDKELTLLFIIIYASSVIFLLFNSELYISVHVNQSCESYETECALGCCPYADAVCCIDGFECCQHGYVCIPFLICIKAVNSNGQISLTSKKSTPVRSPLFKCPPGTTECGPDRCCLYKQGVCCSDGQHCCPNGYR